MYIMFRKIIANSALLFTGLGAVSTTMTALYSQHIPHPYVYTKYDDNDTSADIKLKNYGCYPMTITSCKLFANDQPVESFSQILGDMKNRFDIQEPNTLDSITNRTLSGGSSIRLLRVRGTIGSNLQKTLIHTINHHKLVLEVKYTYCSIPFFGHILTDHKILVLYPFLDTC